jgi:hypothetical protein
VRQLIEQVHLVGAQLPARPRRLRILRGPASGHRHQLPVGVAPHQHAPGTQLDQPVEHLDGHRTGGVVTGDHDQVAGQQVGLGEDGLEHRQHAVDVGQDSD